MDVPLRGRVFHSAGDRAVDTGDRQRIVEDRELGARAHDREDADERFRRDVVVAREPAAVAHGVAIFRGAPLGELSFDDGAPAVSDTDAGFFESERFEKDFGDLVLRRFFEGLENFAERRRGEREERRELRVGEEGGVDEARAGDILAEHRLVQRVQEEGRMIANRDVGEHAVAFGVAAFGFGEPFVDVQFIDARAVRLVGVVEFPAEAVLIVGERIAGATEPAADVMNAARVERIGHCLEREAVVAAHRVTE